MTAVSYAALIAAWFRTRGLSLSCSDIPMPEDEFLELGSLLEDASRSTLLRTVATERRTRQIAPEILRCAVEASRIA